MIHSLSHALLLAQVPLAMRMYFDSSGKNLVQDWSRTENLETLVSSLNHLRLNGRVQVVVFGSEAHQINAEEIQRIISKCIDAMAIKGEAFKVLTAPIGNALYRVDISREIMQIKK